MRFNILSSALLASLITAAPIADPQIQNFFRSGTIIAGTQTNILPSLSPTEDCCAPPIGAYACNDKQIYQLTYVASDTATSTKKAGWATSSTGLQVTMKLFLVSVATVAFLQGAIATPLMKRVTPLKPSFPKYNGADGPPLGAYICNQNQIYQLNYVTTTTVDWILMNTCNNGLKCTINMKPGSEYVGCA
ncbi:UNVERIFIED_CONTAM: hypothetical protein HDU68_012753 [Siphonaria sp. JEL0065]|nr:hypothetical protein HDU68_012753 [Siphonaria sp. JEL0065]